MRVLLLTGKGGVGKTTVAAGTAAAIARSGRKTLVLSTDAAHSLGDAYAVDLPGDEPVEVEPGLFVQHVRAHRRFERSWGEVQRYLLEALDAAGVDPLEAEELTVLPGAEEVLALLEVRDQIRSGRWDVVVVDCAPTAETLRLLALPDVLGWYVRRLFPAESRLARSLRPVLGKVAGAPLPPDSVFDGVERLGAELADVRAVLRAPGTTVRIVLTPESMVVAEARRTLTALSLYGYRVDGVVANRIFPAGAADGGWLAGWAAAQAAQLDEVESSFAPLPVHRVPYAATEPVGLDALAALADATYGGTTAGLAGSLDGPPVADVMTVERAGEGYELSLALPFAERGDMALARSGDDLVVTVAGHRRLVALPSALRRCTVAGATLRDDRLRVRFVPDPELWRGM